MTASAVCGDAPAASPAAAATGSDSANTSRPRGRVTGIGWESGRGKADGTLTWSVGAAI